jgi:hypothetical protein
VLDSECVVARIPLRNFVRQHRDTFRTDPTSGNECDVNVVTDTIDSLVND